MAPSDQLSEEAPSHNIFSSFQSQVQHAAVCLATSFRLWLQLVDVQSKERGWMLLFLNIYPRQSSTCKKQPWPGLNLPAVEAAPAGYRQETCSCPWVIELCHKPPSHALWKKQFGNLRHWKNSKDLSYRFGAAHRLLKTVQSKRFWGFPSTRGISALTSLARAAVALQLCYKLQNVIAQFLLFVHIFSILICK